MTKSLHITFKDGSNPYVRFNMDIKTYKNELIKWRRNYNIISADEEDGCLYITVEQKSTEQLREQKRKGKAYYERMKRRARNTAQCWQAKFAEESMSYEELLEAQIYFENLGRRYGLLAEFRENGIC